MPDLKRLQALVADIERQVGTWSDYTTVVGRADGLVLADKPGQQYIVGLGSMPDVMAPLSYTEDKTPLSADNAPDVVINSFAPATYPGQLYISGTRTKRLLNSAKVYINTDVFPQGVYHDIVANRTLHAQDKTTYGKNGPHWQNMAVAICHVQEVDFLVEQSLSPEGKAITVPRIGAIADNAPAALMLSSPALNFSYGQARELTDAQRLQFIKGMYRNLFDAASSEGRNYIVLPAAGLGAFEGPVELYFEQLMLVAQEFPELNVIYHPSRYGRDFKKALTKHQPQNVEQATKDIVFMTKALIDKGYSCAFHNPSDADVVYSVYDIGEHWKRGVGARDFVGEEYLGVTTTGVVNSYGLNPTAYERVIERSLTPQALKPELVEHATLIQRMIHIISDNIRDKTNGRTTWFTSNTDTKLQKLTAMSEWIDTHQDTLKDKQQEEIILAVIQHICSIKRNTLGLFPPHSENEFNMLLKNYGLRASNEVSLTYEQSLKLDNSFAIDALMTNLFNAHSRKSLGAS